MEVLVYSDLHSSDIALKSLPKILAARKIDLVISPGDIVDRLDNLSEVYVRRFTALCRGHGAPLKVVFGNNDPDAIIDLFEKLDISLHNQSYDQGGYIFVGIGDIEVHQDRMIDPTDLPIAGNILVTHRPPSQLVKTKFANAPAVHITGHLHSKGFVKNIAGVQLIKAPPALEGRAAILRLPQKKVQFIQEL